MNKYTGFTLIEVLIAMVILTVGLLGLAALQATSLKNNQSAYHRSQATQLAYDIADRMRTNVSASSNYVSTVMLPSVAQNKSTACLAVTTNCTPTIMAEHDLYEWNNAMQTSLPKGAIGRITAATAGGVITYTVTIQWDENRDDTIDDKDPIFSTSFRL